MGYSIDLKKISIESYKENLKTADLLPSHTILNNCIEEKFKRIKKQKIENVEELRLALRSKTKLQDSETYVGFTPEKKAALHGI